MKLAIIGGSLLKDVNSFSKLNEERIKTPFGTPSDKFISAMIEDTEVVFLNRHGFEHHIAPHQVNYKANMFALKMQDITHIIAVTAVGGITEKMAPMKWVIPDQIIDYTHGRMHTYNDGSKTEVNHIDFSYPYDKGLSLKLGQALDMEACSYEPKATYGATQGPRLETVAEIKRMQADGCDIVGMTGMPEAALARELEMDYAGLSLVVNWAAGKGDNGQGLPKTVSMEEIGLLIEQGNQLVEKIICNTVSILNN